MVFCRRATTEVQKSEVQSSRQCCHRVFNRAVNRCENETVTQC
uniref:Uncharacterized protein n=1 Tax=Setaria italica TaxID=4555 RepID=K4A479_SETIT